MLHTARGQWLLTACLFITVLLLGLYVYNLHSRLGLVARQLDAQSARLEAGVSGATATDISVAGQLRGLHDALKELQEEWAATGLAAESLPAISARLDAIAAAFTARDARESGLRAQVEDIRTQLTAAGVTGLRGELASLSSALAILEASVYDPDGDGARIFSPVTLYNRAKDAVVSVYVDGKSVGAGFVVGAEKRYVVTAWHVVEAARPPANISISVRTFDGYRTGARLARTSTPEDLVLLELDMPLHQVTPLKLADPSGFVVGQPVMAIGNPLQFQWSASTGIITRLNPIPAGVLEATPCRNCASLVQFDGVIATGNSGGPLLDIRGDVVGMVSFGATTDEINFAIPSNTIRTLIDSIVKE
jgi:S1-C subfamily serine protease